MEEFHLWNSSRNLFGSSPCSSAVNGGVGWSNYGGMKPATRFSGGGSRVVEDAHHLAEDWNQDMLSQNYSSNQIEPNSFPLFHEMNSTDQFLPNFDHFIYNTTLLNATTAAPLGDVQTSFRSSTHCPSSSSISKANAKGPTKFGNESAIKRPRVETPSPLPVFKVRKEKLGDRVTALQQLVSPFGKTDTASVLHEAIEYIKLLHDQVSVLSTPYLKNGSSPLQCQKGADKIKDEEEAMKDLRSRGLCLVPVASTFPIAAEASPEFSTPTFGGRFR